MTGRGTAQRRWRDRPGTARPRAGDGVGVIESGDDLRQIVAAEHGLSPQAARFLVEQSLAELEASAVKLSGLIAANREREPEQPESLADVFADAAAEKVRRQATILRALHGQPRDERGRWQAKSTGFDGGARTPTPVKRPPEQEHTMWLGRRLAESRAGRSSGWS